MGCHFIPPLLSKTVTHLDDFRATAGYLVLSSNSACVLWRHYFFKLKCRHINKSKGHVSGPYQEVITIFLLLFWKILIFIGQYPRIYPYFPSLYYGFIIRCSHRRLCLLLRRRPACACCGYQRLLHSGILPSCAM